MGEENLSEMFGVIGGLASVWGALSDHIGLLVLGFFSLLIACIIITVEWLKSKRPKKIKITNKEMIAKIFDKFHQMRDVLKTFNENGKKKEDEPAIVESIKVIVKELSDVLNEKAGDDVE